jgi:hypothetical protein
MFVDHGSIDAIADRDRLSAEQQSAAKGQAGNIPAADLRALTASRAA